MFTEENEEQTNEVTETFETTQEESQEENEDFDASAFLTGSEEFPGATEDGAEEEDTEEEETEKESPADTADSPWDMDDTDDDNNDDGGIEEGSEEEESTDDTVDTVPEDDTTNEILHKFKDLGIEAENIDDLYKQVEGAMQERAMYQRSKYTNKNIENWKKALSLEDRDIVYRNYLAEGASKEAAEEMTNNLEANGMLKDKSHEIRVAIRSSINRETDRLEQSDKQSVAMQQKREEEARQQLKSHLDKTETMFGFKMAKPDKLDNTRKDHFDYIQSGKFGKEVMSSPEVLSEVAWFTRHRKQIIKALMNKGIQTGKEELLKDIQNPSDNDSLRIPTPDGNSEFNASKFISEE
jgi:hypothetical protein